MNQKENTPAGNEGASSSKFFDLDSTVDTYTNQEINLEELLSPEHLSELRGSAISDSVIACSGVHSAYDVEELPADARYLDSNGPAIYPVLVFPKHVAGFGDSWQVKPQPGSISGKNGKRPPKYIGPAETASSPCLSLIEHLALSSSTKTVLVVEGTKQPLAVQSNLPDNCALYSISGIHSWKTKHDDKFNPAFSTFKNLQVVIVPDADAASNHSVFDGAKELGDYISAQGAMSVYFAQIPGDGTTGVDDYLAGLPESERLEAVQRLITKAKSKPASRRPSKKSALHAEAKRECAAAEERGMVPIESGPSSDKNARINMMVDAVAERFGGDILFRQEMILSRRFSDNKSGKSAIAAVSLADMLSMLLDSVYLYSVGSESITNHSPTRLDAEVILSRIVQKVPPLHGIRYTPLLKNDGTWVTTSGYDSDSGLYLHLPSEFEGVQIPARPSQDDVERSKNILYEVYQDFPIRKPADYTRILAGAITPFVRHLCGLAPLFVITATDKGTGKGTLANTYSLLSTGRKISVKLPTKNPEEMRKSIFAQLLDGRPMVFLDEIAEIDNESLNAVLTSEDISDRILGESKTPEIVNQTCFYAAGNNVTVKGDTIRRVCVISLAWSDPTVRPYERIYTNTDLLGVVKNRRADLVRAIMTLISAWFDADEPNVPSYSAKPWGTYFEWHRIVGGVLHFAGFPDIMEGVNEFRENHDPSVLADRRFVCWLYSTFSDQIFTAADVAKKIALTSPTDMPLPAKVSESKAITSKVLGKALSQLADVFLGENVIRTGAIRHNTKSYYIENRDDSEDNSTDKEANSFLPSEDPGVLVGPTPSANTTVVFDLETGSASDLHVTDDPGYIRLAAYSVNGAEPVTTTDIEGDLLPILESADTLVGHNVLQFDLPALKRLYGLDTDSLVQADRVQDTLVMARLSDPPLGKEKKYSLGAVATRLGVDGKLVDKGQSVLDKLAEQYGGYGKIPVDNAEYCTYAMQDVRATAEIHQRLLPLALDVVGADYMNAEHKKVQLIANVEASGVCIDTALMEKMITAENLTKKEIREWLITEVGIPSSGKAPWTSNAGKQAIEKYLAQFSIEVPRTEKGAVSISVESLKGLAIQHSTNNQVAILATKMEELLQSNSPAPTVKKYLHKGRVYPSISSTQATGRLSTTKPAMTVFGSREDRLLVQRAMILPDNKADVLVSVDLSQIDARCMAAGSGDKNYAALFAAGRDSHTEMALRVFGDPSRRGDAKALAHAANYGMGARMFAQNAGIPLEEAETLLARLKAEFPVLEEFKDQLRTSAQANGFITTGFGRRVAVPKGREYTSAPAAFGQGTARDAFLNGVLMLPADIAAMIRIFVHDEIVLSVPVSRAEEIKSAVSTAFESTELPCTDGVVVPIFTDAGGPGSNWSECK